jgi:hypothetical protein
MLREPDKDGLEVIGEELLCLTSEIAHSFVRREFGRDAKNAPAYCD